MAGRFAFVLLAVAALAAWVDLVEPFTSASEAGEAAEAHALVQRLAVPRLAGSDALGRAIDDVDAELCAMPNVVTQRVSGWKKSDARYFDAPIFVYATALVARLPGAAPSEGTRIAFSAHLDSVAHAPGVGDDLVGVAGVVEAMRHASRTRPKGDVVAVVSVQEEGCVTCAAQLVAGAAEAPPIDVVIVVDESGNAPPVSAFDALRDDAAGTQSSGLVAASRHAFGWTLVSDVVHALGLGVGRTEMTDLATRLGPDHQGARPADRGPPVPAIAVGAMRGQGVYHTACDDLAHAHPALVDDVVRVTRELVALADEPRDRARDDVLALRVPFAGTVALPRVVIVVLTFTWLAVLLVALVRRRAHVKSIVVGGVVVVACAVVAGVASSFAPAADLATMARAGEAQCAALLAASLGVILMVRGLVATRVDAHAFAVGVLGAAFAAGAVPALLATFTFASLSGFLTLACAAGLAGAPFIARSPPPFVRALACAPLVVMTTQLAIILGANWWSLALGGTGAPFVGLTGALLAGACVLAIIDDAPPRLVGAIGAGLLVLGALAAIVVPRIARTNEDDTCPPSVQIDYFHDVTTDTAVLFTHDAQAELVASAPMQAFLNESMTRPLEGAGVERADSLTALWDNNEPTSWRVRDVASRVPPPRTTLVRVDDRARERMWTVHIEPAQEPGVLMLHDDTGPPWRSIAIADGVALPLEGKTLSALLLATPRAGVDIVIATALDVDTLQLRITEQGRMPDGLLPSMVGRVSPSSGRPQTERPSPAAFVRAHERLTRASQQ